MEGFITVYKNFTSQRALGIQIELYLYYTYNDSSNFDYHLPVSKQMEV